MNAGGANEVVYRGAKIYGIANWRTFVNTTPREFMPVGAGILRNTMCSQPQSPYKRFAGGTAAKRDDYQKLDVQCKKALWGTVDRLEEGARE